MTFGNKETSLIEDLDGISPTCRDIRATKSIQKNYKNQKRNRDVLAPEGSPKRGPLLDAGVEN